MGPTTPFIHSLPAGGFVTQHEAPACIRRPAKAQLSKMAPPNTQFRPTDRPLTAHSFISIESAFKKGTLQFTSSYF